MTFLVPIVMFAWPLVVALLFLAWPVQRAVVAAMLAAWLFLPVAEFSIPGFTDYNKMTATCGGVLAGVLLTDRERIVRFRFSLADLPMLVWCVTPFVSSINNDHGIYDGISAVVYQTVTWGVPYFLGRMCLGDREGVRLLALGIVVGGLIYVPFCLFEMRMSPQLHNSLYGSQPGTFATTMRYGGFRPTVFMAHGLMVAVWMCSATLVAAWLCLAGVWKQFTGYDARLWLVPLIATTLLCKSTGALALFFFVASVIASAIWTNSGRPVFTLIALPSLWMISRGLGWSAAPVLALASSLGSDRAGSLRIRLEQEDSVISFALQKPWFGWGNWLTGLDQLWLLTIRNYGLVGIIAFTLSFILPMLLLVCRSKPRQWLLPAYAPCAALAVIVLLYSLDHLFNGMVNPIFMIAAGAAIGLLISPQFVEEAIPNQPNGHAGSIARRRRLPVRRLRTGHA